MYGLEGKSIIVTGGANGIGAAIVKTLAERGARVVIADMADEKGAAYADELRGQSHDVVFQHLDVTSLENWEECAQNTKEAFGRIDSLVNCAGLSQTGQLLCDLDLNRDWHLLLNIDLTGPFYGMRTVVPYLRESNGGSIVNIASVAGLVGQCGANGYSAAKGGVIALSKAAAVELANDLIRVNAVCPSVTATDTVKGIFDAMEGVEEMMKADCVYPRFGTPEDIASAVAFMCSDDSSYVTGQVLCVDGGFTAR